MKKSTESSFLDGRREYYDRYFQLAKLANNWRLAFFGTLAGLIILAIGMVMVALQQKVVPFAVELNGNSEVVRVTRADVLAKPTDNQVAASLRLFIIGARTVFLDRRAQQMQMSTAYSMILAGSAAYQAMKDFHTTNNPYERSKEVTVEVAVTSVPKISDDTWQVEWTETTKQLSGRVVSAKSWQGTFKVRIVPPENEHEIGVNPFGIYVEWFSWTTRI